MHPITAKKECYIYLICRYMLQEARTNRETKYAGHPRCDRVLFGADRQMRRMASRRAGLERNLNGIAQKAAKLISKPEQGSEIRTTDGRYDRRLLLGTPSPFPFLHISSYCKGI